MKSTKELRRNLIIAIDELLTELNNGRSIDDDIVDEFSDFQDEVEECKANDIKWAYKNVQRQVENPNKEEVKEALLTSKKHLGYRQNL